MITITLNQSEANGQKTCVILVFEGLNLVVGTLDETLQAAAEAAHFTGKAGQSAEILGHSDYARILLLGLGEKEVLDEAVMRSAGAEATKKLELNTEAASADLGALSPGLVGAFALGAQLRSYRFDKYRTQEKESKKPKLKILDLRVEGKEICEAQLSIVRAIAEGVALSQDLVSEPANVLYPKSYAERIQQKFEGSGVCVKILDKAALEDLGMGALLAVGRGSRKEPYVVVMHYKGSEKGENHKPLALVGKGVTFDTGGISLKPPQGMWDMKWDMGGSAIVCGTMFALARRQAKANVVGIIGLAENMPDGDAQRPGDIVRSMSGKTIEVLNTDAEGRLVLADILTYVQRLHKPRAIVDLATLTGAIMVALGGENAGLFSNNDSLADALAAASKKSGDALWRMPLGKAYDRQLNCEAADMRNISPGRWGGAITAACFLERFIEEDRPWAHLDVAGMVWSDTGRDLSRKGATGYGVRLLNQLIHDSYEGA